MTYALVALASAAFTGFMTIPMAGEGGFHAGLGAMGIVCIVIAALVELE